jgi:hypothetical protein
MPDIRICARWFSYTAEGAREGNRTCGYRVSHGAGPRELAGKTASNQQLATSTPRCYAPT